MKVALVELALVEAGKWNSFTKTTSDDLFFAAFISVLLSVCPLRLLAPLHSIVRIGSSVSISSSDAWVFLADIDHGRIIARKARSFDRDSVGFTVNVEFLGCDYRELNSDVQQAVVDAVRERGLACGGATQS